MTVKPSQQPPFGPYEELPNWVFDVVMAIDKYEDEHPSNPRCPVPRADGVPVFISGHQDSPDFAGWSWCIKAIQDLIPREVHEVAEHIRKYELEKVR